MANVLKILQCSNLGGMEQATYWVLDYLYKKNTRFRILTPRPFGKGKTRLKTIDPGAQDFDYKGKFGWRTHSVFKDAVEAAAKYSNLVWITGTDTTSLVAIRNLKLPKVLGHHFHHGTSLTDRIKWTGFYKLLCRQLDFITYPTRFTMNEAINLCPWIKEKAVYVPYTFEMKFESIEELRSKRKAARIRLGLPEDGLIIGNAGWFIPRKRWDIFLKTAKIVSSLLPNAIFVLCGGGPLENDLRNQAQKLGIKDQVVFNGWVQNPDDFFWAWDVCLFNSDYDALGRTPIEAACCGAIPVASVKYGGLSEFLKDGIHGFITDRHDPNLLAERIIYLHKNSHHADEFLKNMRGNLKGSFSIKQATEFYDQFS